MSDGSFVLGGLSVGMGAATALCLALAVSAWVVGFFVDGGGRSGRRGTSAMGLARRALTV